MFSSLQQFYFSGGNPCDIHSTVGVGNSNLRRWTFNVNSGTCEEFVYHGMMGNANNFLSLTDCDEKCYSNK